MPSSKLHATLHIESVIRYDAVRQQTTFERVNRFFSTSTSKTCQRIRSSNIVFPSTKFLTS